ncbi:MAG: TfuA-related McrA-glycine thioamidation protein [Methanomassiliicoccales archaeon]|nr:TfuA-related McrA-glycine thioamidation protein [Methanomassiliicoccales archaeon]
MSRPVIYLGPSLSREEAVRVLDADFQPPVKRGDLGQLEDVDVVGIIDGAFLQNCSVGHREILSLLKRGVTVVGGGSMGALRAAELRSYGMIGVGRIFEMYAGGEIQGDDEVALVFDPDTLEPLSEPLINMRFFLRSANQAEVLDDDEAQELLRSIQGVYYPRRNISLFKNISRSVLSPERHALLISFLEDNYQDIKREDAITLLKFIVNLVKK